MFSSGKLCPKESFGDINLILFYRSTYLGFVSRNPVKRQHLAIGLGQC